MKFYRKATLAVVMGTVSGTIYRKCKNDVELRKTVLNLGGASVLYTSVCFATTALIPRFKFACIYVTLTAFVTSANFLFTRQFLLEREWLCRKQRASRSELSAVSAVAGAETGLILEGVLTEGALLSTARAVGFWSLVGLGLQLGWFCVEDWRVRRSLMLHHPELYPAKRLDVGGKSFRVLEGFMLAEWEIDRVRQENKRIDVLFAREVDRLQQLERVLRENGVEFEESDS